MDERTRPVNVAILHAPEDEAPKRQMEAHLSMLRRGGFVDVWHEGMIEPGAERDRAVAEALGRADIVLLLISVNFLAPQCYDHYAPGLRLAYERQTRGEVKIVPVLLRECDWELDVLRGLVPLPRSRVPLGSPQWESPDRAFHVVVQELRALADEVRRTWRPPPAPPPATSLEGTATETTGEDAVPEALIARLLDILVGRATEDGIAEFRKLAHRSLFALGVLDPGFRRHKLEPAFGRARLYHRPPVILASQQTDLRSLGPRGEREPGYEVNYTLARTDDLGGMPGHVRIFFPRNGGNPTISGFNL